MNWKTFFKIALIIIGSYLVVKWLSKKLSKPKFDTMGNRTDWSLEDVKNALAKVSQKYGTDFARKLEQLYRIETGHFTSGQWKKTLSPGMEIAGGTTSTKNTFPFGWSSLQKFINANPNYIKENFYVARVNENTTNIGKTYVGFPDVETSFMFISWFIKNIRNGRFGYWKSLNESSALSYENALNTINTKYA